MLWISFSGGFVAPWASIANAAQIATHVDNRITKFLFISFLRYCSLNLVNEDLLPIVSMLGSGHIEPMPLGHQDSSPCPEFRRNFPKRFVMVRVELLDYLD